MTEHTGHRMRLRERAVRGGLTNMEEHEVLELLLMETIPRRDVNLLAHNLIDHFGSLADVLDASAEDLMEVPGVGKLTAVHLTLQPALLRYYQHNRWGKKVRLTNFGSAGEYCTTLFDRQQEEQIFMILLDRHSQVLAVETLAFGTVGETPIYIRKVLEIAMRHHASAVMLAHNHPGGDLTPSDADFQSTEKIRQALKTLDIPLLAHFIVAGPRYADIPLNREVPLKVFDSRLPGKSPELQLAAEKKH